MSAGDQLRRSPGRLSDLLAINEEMIEQWRAEARSVGGTTDFPERMIGEHEKVVALIRRRLDGREPPRPSAKTGGPQTGPGAFRRAG